LLKKFSAKTKIRYHEVGQLPINILNKHGSEKNDSEEIEISWLDYLEHWQMKTNAFDRTDELIIESQPSATNQFETRKMQPGHKSY